MRVEPQQLKAFILDAGLVSPEELKKADQTAQETKADLGAILIKAGLIAEVDLIKLHAYILGIPFIDLEKEKVKPEILKIIPEPIAKKHNIVAFKKTGGDLEVAMLDPEDLETIEFIKKKTNLRILPRLTSPASVKNIIFQYQKTLEAEFGELIQKETGAIPLVKVEEKIGEETPDLRKAAEELPIIRIVDTLIKHAILSSASDIHIEPAEKEVIIRYRIDGILHDAMILPKKVHTGIIARIKILSNLRIDEHRLPQDGRFKMEDANYKISFRVSIIPVFDGEKIVLRLLPETSLGLSLESIGLRGQALEIVHSNIKKPVGMILVSGPTGSGKTTTLYSILDIINIPGINISTLEDPIEYRLPRINQTQISPAIGLTFGSGLRALVRQDPNIILVGEIRDEETVDLAINAALTGHLVLSSIHTNSASGAIPRLIDMRAQPFLIASTANLIIAQRLVRRLCPDREKYRLNASQIKTLGESIDLNRVLDILKKEKIIKPKTAWTEIDFYRAKKSESCPEGYKGRIGIYEVLEITNEIKDLITKKATSDEIENQARQDEMITMLEDGIIKAVQGITTIEEVLRVTRE
ncbi:MAG: type II/IV secretion system protein [Parcubacteria group bacterium]|nr:type II/IV secretion system protein [Parcubacteria group bacterium]